MPKSTTAKGTAARPPYKIKSAGTKWGIPPDSSEDSTPAPAQACITEEQPVELKISQLVSVEKDIPDKVGDELLPRAASEGDAGTSTAKPALPEGKKALQKAKTMPVKATERGSFEVCEQDYEITTTYESDSDDGWDDGWMTDEQLEKWVVEEVKERAVEAGMSTDDWIANEYGNDEWYFDEFEQGAFDGMSKDDADAKMAQIFRSCGQ
ncbi:hypothetical protein EDD22DRAFT_868132 [Suillus occidentalis]|nr:hypothetical protein EDD22DRAFT_868132 [Suillus occidentalis]